MSDTAEENGTEHRPTVELFLKVSSVNCVRCQTIGMVFDCMSLVNRDGVPKHDGTDWTDGSPSPIAVVRTTRVF